MSKLKNLADEISKRIDLNVSLSKKEINIENKWKVLLKRNGCKLYKTTDKMEMFVSWCRGEDLAQSVIDTIDRESEKMFVRETKSKTNEELCEYLASKLKDCIIGKSGNPDHGILGIKFNNKEFYIKASYEDAEAALFRVQDDGLSRRIALLDLADPSIDEKVYEFIGGSNVSDQSRST